MPPLSRAQINGIKDFSLRTVLLSVHDQLTLLNLATGTNWLEPTNSPQHPAIAPPPRAGFSVVGANGAFNVQIANAAQSANKPLYHELSYSPSPSFTSDVTTLPASTATQQTVPSPGITAHWRLRSSYDLSNWNEYQLHPGGTVAAGLQSSAASESALPLNQTNFASIDSFSTGLAVNIRIYGRAGPTSQYAAVKGGTQTLLPSASIINAKPNSTQVVGYDGSNYMVRNTMPAVLADGIIPTGNVSVVGLPAPTPPTIHPILQSGYIVGYEIVDGGAGATGPYDLNLGSVGGGKNAAPGAQTIKNGVLVAIAPGNPGNGSYSGGTNVSVQGGVLNTPSGGGRNIGGNGGRLVTNDGTTGSST